MRHGWARILTLPGVLVGLALVWWLWPATPRLFVAEVHGPLTLSRPGVDQPIDAQVGTALQSDDNVSTGGGAEAVLQFGPSTQIRVGPTSSLEVASVDDEGLSLELAGGSVRAIVRPDSGQVRIGSQGRAVVASEATVDVGVRDDIMQVRAVQGDVALQGLDRDHLAEGEQAVIADRTARVGKVPASLLLAVAPPEVGRTAAAAHLVRGQTAPGAEVILRGPVRTERVIADENGRFAVPVDLAEGENEVLVEVTDVFGTKRTTQTILPVRDTQGPVLRGDVEYP